MPVQIYGNDLTRATHPFSRVQALSTRRRAPVDHHLARLRVQDANDHGCTFVLHHAPTLFEKPSPYDGLQLLNTNVVVQIGRRLPLDSCLFDPRYELCSRYLIFLNTERVVRAAVVPFQELSGILKSISVYPPSDHPGRDRKSTRLNSSHVKISYAVFCLKKKKYLLIK